MPERTAEPKFALFALCSAPGPNCSLRLGFFMANRSTAATRIWLVPLSIVGGACLLLFAATFLLDAAHSTRPSDVFALLMHPNPAAAFNTLTNTGDIVA